MTTKIEADYLVIGAGAMGMAFTDTLVTETNATVAIVDRYHQPGGHWTTAYPFVRLHQPSSFYGVNSRSLGSDSIDRSGWNEGLYELATGSEVCAYFAQVMQQQLLPTKRVSYFPMSEYEGEGRFRSIASGEVCEVKVRRRIVDASYMRVTVPSMRPPPFEIAPGVQCVTPNDLVRTDRRSEHYTIVGAGKTGIDACLWLLQMGVDPGDLTWIMPRDAWLVDRARVQPGAQFAKAIAEGLVAQRQAIAQATSVEDLFDRLNACGQLLRLADNVRPTMYRCATVSQAELAQLRRIEDVVRLGRLRRVEQNRLVLGKGAIPAAPGTLYIDCSADGLERRSAVPIFDGQRMTLQSIRTCQQVFSAALSAHVETTYSDDAIKNAFCSPVPHPNSDLDWLRATLASSQNQLRWVEDPGMREWLEKSRLDYLGNLGPRVPPDPQIRLRMLDNFRAYVSAQNAKLERLLSNQTGDFTA